MSAESRSEAEIDRKLAELERDVAARRAAVGQPGGTVTAGGPITTRYPARDDGPGWKFLLGLLLVAFGGWAVLSNVVVTSGFFGGFFGFGMSGLGGGGFGWVLLPIVAGIALVVARPGYPARAGGNLGWVLIAAGSLFIFAEVLSSLHIWFRPVSLPSLLMMVAPIGIGLGLILADLLRPRPAAQRA